MPPTDLIDRYRGCLLGLAAGDALGAPIEGLSPGMVAPMSGMIGGGPLGLGPGQWTDDTAMALCLATSLIHCRGFDPVDQLSRYLRWYREGYCSSTGECVGIGRTTRDAIERFERTGDPYCGSADPRTAGNGSLMRLAPIPLLFRARVDQAIARAGDSSRTTHGAREAIDACRYFSGLIIGALSGGSRSELLAGRYQPIPGIWDRNPLAPAVDEVARGSYATLEPPVIRASGYVVKTLEAALWAIASTDSFADAVLAAVNLGDDADTAGAVCGQLAGALYGVDQIPGEWREQVHDSELIVATADRLLKLSQ